MTSKPATPENIAPDPANTTAAPPPASEPKAELPESGMEAEITANEAQPAAPPATPDSAPPQPDLADLIEGETVVEDPSPLAPFTDFVGFLAEGGLRIEDPAMGYAMSVTNIKLDLPVELGITVDDNGGVSLTGAPPTQHQETTIMPVLHQMTLNIALDHEEPI